MYEYLLHGASVDAKYVASDWHRTIMRGTSKSGESTFERRVSLSLFMLPTNQNASSYKTRETMIFLGGGV